MFAYLTSIFNWQTQLASLTSDTVTGDNSTDPHQGSQANTLKKTGKDSRNTLFIQFILLVKFL